MASYEEHQEYLKNTNTFRKYGGTPDSQGRVYDLKGKGKEHERQINAPNAKFKRSLRNAQYEGNLNRWGEKELGKMNLKEKKKHIASKMKDKGKESLNIPKGEKNEGNKMQEGRNENNRA